MRRWGEREMQRAVMRGERGEHAFESSPFDVGKVGVGERQRENGRFREVLNGDRLHC